MLAAAEIPLVLTVSLALCVLPGWGLASLVRADALTRLSISTVASFGLMYLLALLAYLVRAPLWVPFVLAVALALGSLFMGLRVTRLRRDKATPCLDGIASWAALASWILAMQVTTVVYGAVAWYGDWLEHYERSLFFVENWPPNSLFLMDRWTLPARGPVFNAAAGLQLSGLGRSFSHFQIISTVFNTYTVLPAALLLRDLCGLRQRSALLLAAAVLGLAPFAVQQETFTWTKFLTVAFILQAFHLYLLGLKEGQLRLAYLSIPVMACGILVHYLALVYAGFLICHLLTVARKEGGEKRHLVKVTVGSALLLTTWFGFCFMTYGAKETFLANSTLGGNLPGKEEENSGPSPGGIFAGNLITTALPYGWRHDLPGLGRSRRLVQADPRAGPLCTPDPEEQNRLWEWFGDLVQNARSVPGALGWAGAIGLLMAGVASTRRGTSRCVPEEDSSPWSPLRRPGPGFWLLTVLAGAPLNILLFRQFVPEGVVHLNLQPYLFLALVCIVRYSMEAPLIVRVALCVIFAAESALGCVALLVLQARPVPFELLDNGRYHIFGKLALNTTYVDNYILKVNKNISYLSDRLDGSTASVSLAAVLLAAVLLFLVWRGRPNRETAPGPK